MAGDGGDGKLLLIGTPYAGDWLRRWFEAPVPTTPLKTVFGDIPVRIDPTLPRGRVEFRVRDTVVGDIVGLAVEDADPVVVATVRNALLAGIDAEIADILVMRARQHGRGWVGEQVEAFRRYWDTLASCGHEARLRGSLRGSRG